MSLSFGWACIRAAPTSSRWPIREDEPSRSLHCNSLPPNQQYAARSLGLRSARPSFPVLVAFLSPINTVLRLHHRENKYLRAPWPRKSAQKSALKMSLPSELLLPAASILLSTARLRAGCSEPQGRLPVSGHSRFSGFDKTVDRGSSERTCQDEAEELKAIEIFRGQTLQFSPFGGMFGGVILSLSSKFHANYFHCQRIH